MDNFKYFLNNTIEAIGIFQDGKCVYVNEAGLKLFGFNEQKDIIDKTHFDFVSSSYHEIVKNRLEAKYTLPYEIVAKRRDGTTFPALIKGHNKIINGKLARIVSLLDLTDSKQKENELKLAKIKAEDSAKIKAEFLANMSHEIRTPLGGITGMTYLAMQTRLDKQQKRYIQNIDNSAKMLLEIINDILDFSKIEAGKLEIKRINFNLDNIISNIKNMLKIRAHEKGLVFNINYDKYNTIFYGDPLRISQILTNLLSNAIKFTNRGKVELKITKQQENIVRFEIKDTGIGLSQEQQDKLFKPFSQADGSTTRRFGGTGLGLSISKKLVELMGGKIWVKSKLKQGSNFIFEIKLPFGSFNKLDDESSKNSYIKNLETIKNGKILLAEDNSINREILVGFLQKFNISIDMAINGKKAVELVIQNLNKYDLILMDIQMPIMDGYEAAKIIKSINPNIPIIALTANAMREDIQKSKAAGMNEHLNKPIDLNRLYEVVAKYTIDKNTKNGITKDNGTKKSDFMHINKKVGLKFFADDKKLYHEILKDFYKKYKNISLEKLNDEELMIIFHSIKGLGASIGAMPLSKIAEELENTLDKNLFDTFYKELKMVTNDLQKFI
jgi:PAS domain S-box-containing protein